MDILTYALCKASDAKIMDYVTSMERLTMVVQDTVPTVDTAEPNKLYLVDTNHDGVYEEYVLAEISGVEQIVELGAVVDLDDLVKDVLQDSNGDIKVVKFDDTESLIEVDQTPTEDSLHLISSDAVYKAIAASQEVSINIKTVTASTSESTVQFNDTYPYVWVRNIGKTKCYVSNLPNIVAQANDVACIGTFECVMIQTDTDSIYVKADSGTPKLEIHAQSFSECPFSGFGADNSAFGDLAYKDTASATYTPTGSVGTPTFTGTEGSVSVSGTPAGSVSITPTTASVTGITAVGTLPSFSYNGTTENLSFSAGTLPTADTAKTVMTGATAAFSGTDMTATGSFTPAGTVSAPAFTGTEATITVS